MCPKTSSQTQQSPSGALPGTWKLAAGRAITLQPREAGVLRVAHGRMWVTFDGPHEGPRNDQGDQVLDVGAELHVIAGRRLVVETWSANSPAYFSWDPLPVRIPAETPRLAPVLQPLADLRLAIEFGAGAAGRLAAGLVTVCWEVVAGSVRGGAGLRAHNSPWPGPSLPSTNSNATKSWTSPRSALPTGATPRQA